MYFRHQDHDTKPKNIMKLENQFLLNDCILHGLCVNLKAFYQLFHLYLKAKLVKILSNQLRKLNPCAIKYELTGLY